MKVLAVVALLVSAVSCQKGKVVEPGASRDSSASSSEAGRDARPATAAIPEGSKWSGSDIPWQSLDEGLALAKAENRPVMMVVKTEWCPRCKEFSALFRDETVERAADDFVMILVDGDEDARAGEFAPDGTYIPRTFFLTPAGDIETSLHGPNPRYRYFINSGRPETLVRLMARARKVLGG